MDKESEAKKQESELLSEVGEDTTKYGEFISSYFAWVSLPQQKGRVNELEEMTKKEEKNIEVHSGADEGGLTLLARILTKIKGYTPKICPIYPKEECKNVIPLFEDKEVYKSIEAQIESAGASLSDEKDSEIYLFCNLPVGKMQNIDNLKGRQYDERDCRL